MTDDYHPCGGLTPLLVALATGLVLKFSASTQLPVLLLSISDVPIPYIRLYTVCICFFKPSSCQYIRKLDHIFDTRSRGTSA